MQKDLEQSKIDKFEKVLLQRIARLTKSHISEEDGIGLVACSLRYMLTGSCNYWTKQVPNCLSEYSTLASMDTFPLTEVMYWSEDVKGELANIRLDAEVSEFIDSECSYFEDTLQRIVNETFLEGCHLTIDGIDFGELDNTKLKSQLLLGMFLTYILDKFHSSEIKSEDYHRFIDQSDCIALRLNLFKYSDLLSHFMYSKAEEIEPSVYFDFVFRNGMKKPIVCDGGSSRKIDRHSSFIQENGDDLLNSSRVEPTSSGDER